VKLHAVDAEGPPPDPRASGEPRALGNLPGMQYRKQRRVDEQRLRVADHLGEDLPSQRFQKAPELPHSPMERGRMKPHHPGEQVPEEPLGVAQERALALHPSKLLKERERDDFRIRQPLEGLLASGVGVEESVGVVYEAEEDGQGLFRVGEPWGMVGSGHLSLLGEGRLRWPTFYLLSNPRNTHLKAFRYCRGDG
jgi:hypothetical protein